MTRPFRLFVWPPLCFGQEPKPKFRGLKLAGPGRLPLHDPHTLNETEKTRPFHPKTWYKDHQNVGLCTSGQLSSVRGRNPWINDVPSIEPMASQVAAIRRRQNRSSSHNL
jgi:hypothetical protein